MTSFRKDLVSVLKPKYLGIALDFDISKNEIIAGIYIHDGGCFWHYKKITCKNNDEILSFLINYQKEKNSKFILAGLTSTAVYNKESKISLGVLFWTKLDILSGLVETKHTTLEEKASSAARKSFTWLSHSIIPGVPKVNVDKMHKVLVDSDNKLFFATLESYKEKTNPELWAKIIKCAEKVKENNLSVCFFNSTPTGGGVAIIRHTAIRFLTLLGVKASWFVMKPNPKIFEITKKKFHNTLQGVSSPETHLTDNDKELFQKWSLQNFNAYWSKKSGPIFDASLIVIDDPQPSGLIPYLKNLNKNAIFAYRSHIELRSDLIRNHDSEQEHVWNFLWKNISMCDIFISHPIDYFVPDNVKASNIKKIQISACTDPLDGLNKVMDPYSLDYYQHFFNRISLDQNFKTVDFSRLYFIQIARFDPSKGIPNLIESYVIFRKNMKKLKIEIQDIPQLVICGHSSIDDPESHVIYNNITEILKSEKVKEFANDIIHVMIPPSDQILNAILRQSYLAFQLSLREGYEIKVSEALMKGIPVVGSNVGGIPLQIQNGIDGFLVESGDNEKVAEIMTESITNKEKIIEMSKNALKNDRDYAETPLNVLKYLEIMLEM